jgi:UDP-glucose:(glucosyl)LPS alpha-1,3-glucosyltransferase/UDP-glucose:(galactosyl)LPS alpha-1,2-glucosyltransferase
MKNLTFLLKKKNTPCTDTFCQFSKALSVAASHSAKYLEYYYQSPWKDQPLDAKNSKRGKKICQNSLEAK